MFNHIMKSINVIVDDFTNTLWLSTAVPSVHLSADVIFKKELATRARKPY